MRDYSDSAQDASLRTGDGVKHTLSNAECARFRGTRRGLANKNEWFVLCDISSIPAHTLSQGATESAWTGHTQLAPKITTCEFELTLDAAVSPLSWPEQNNQCREM